MSDFRASDFKENLMTRVSNLIIARNYSSLMEGAKELDSCRNIISQLRRGQACSCSTTRLLHMLHRLGYDVEIKFTRIEK